MEITLFIFVQHVLGILRQHFQSDSIILNN